MTTSNTPTSNDPTGSYVGINGMYADIGYSSGPVDRPYPVLELDRVRVCVHRATDNAVVIWIDTADDSQLDQLRVNVNDGKLFGYTDDDSPEQGEPTPHPDVIARPIGAHIVKVTNDTAGTTVNAEDLAEVIAAITTTQPALIDVDSTAAAARLYFAGARLMAEVLDVAIS